MDDCNLTGRTESRFSRASTTRDFRNSYPIVFISTYQRTFSITKYVPDGRIHRGQDRSILRVLTFGNEYVLVLVTSERSDYSKSG
jgi:hypothetical protein